MASDIRFKGCPYPIVKDPLGLFKTQTGLNQIRSDLLILLLTNPGERVMHPNFGTPLRQLIFEQNDAIIAAQAREVIINAIRTWEPRVVIKSLNVTTGLDNFAKTSVDPNDDRTERDHVLAITIEFLDPEQIQEVQVLDLKIPLGG